MVEPERFLRDEFGKCFALKEKSIGSTTQYLGNKVKMVTLENGRKCWSFASSQYVQNAVKNVENYRNKNCLGQLPRVKSPWSRNYLPESDVSPELSPIMSSYFQSLIGILRWIVELGRADLVMETSALASMMDLPREGHLNAAFHMFAFLKLKHNAVIVFDPSKPEINESEYEKEDWSATPYGKCIEDIPHNSPEPLDTEFVMRPFVDSNHAGDTITRRSRTGFIFFLNSAPTYWYS